MSDWRIDNADRIRGARLRLKPYFRFSESWDHDHCEGCWAKFMDTAAPDVLTEGYVTEDDYHWICPDCFRDLKEEMGWTAI
jgi:hypothetical protein